MQQDNARVHTCKVTMDAVGRNGYELISNLAYSPDLAPSDFFLFPNLTRTIRQSDYIPALALPKHMAGIFDKKCREKEKYR